MQRRIMLTNRAFFYFDPHYEIQKNVPMDKVEHYQTPTQPIPMHGSEYIKENHPENYRFDMCHIERMDDSEPKKPFALGPL